MTLKFKVRKGDRVAILSGKDKGKTGEILEIDRKLNKLKIKSINMIKKHLTFCFGEVWHS
jgi:large subunit ribosomal protein L24